MTFKRETFYEIGKASIDKASIEKKKKEGIYNNTISKACVTYSISDLNWLIRSTGTCTFVLFIL